MYETGDSCLQRIPVSTETYSLTKKNAVHFSESESDKRSESFRLKFIMCGSPDAISSEF